MGFLKKILKLFIKVSRPIFSLEDNTLKFKVNSDYFYTYTLENFEIKTRHDPYVIDAYTLKTKDFFLEHIRVDTDVSWNADALSLYENFLVENLKLKNIKLLEKKEFEHFEFIIYQIDKIHILPLVYVWEVYKDIFILDFNLSLYEDLI
ncbi:hypothetical protein, partial [Arcobacter sp. CECT 8985]|uniref:hypothetical protein n=1 Tax=Arcobacter sp. CECT 8985 TaxID=1935424 RepID=UPI00100A8353